MDLERQRHTAEKLWTSSGKCDVQTLKPKSLTKKAAMQAKRSASTCPSCDAKRRCVGLRGRGRFQGGKWFFDRKAQDVYSPTCTSLHYFCCYLSFFGSELCLIARESRGFTNFARIFPQATGHKGGGSRGIRPPPVKFTKPSFFQLLLNQHFTSIKIKTANFHV